MSNICFSRYLHCAGIPRPHRPFADYLVATPAHVRCLNLSSRCIELRAWRSCDTRSSSAPTLVLIIPAWATEYPGLDPCYRPHAPSLRCWRAGPIQRRRMRGSARSVHLRTPLRKIGGGDSAAVLGRLACPGEKWCLKHRGCVIFGRHPCWRCLSLAFIPGLINHAGSPSAVKPGAAERCRCRIQICRQSRACGLIQVKPGNGFSWGGIQLFFRREVLGPAAHCAFPERGSEASAAAPSLQA